MRLAINPFVSSIGGLFPMIISGGAIVSIVLALPTVGPLLVQALFTEDMYLAGSMLIELRQRLNGESMPPDVVDRHGLRPA